MDIKQKIIQFIRKNKVTKAIDLAVFLGVSRQYASRVLREMTVGGLIVKIGSTRSARYTLPQFMDEIGINKSFKRLKNKDLKEYEILADLVVGFPAYKQAPENGQSIISYAFSEMLNNAIEHSASKDIEVQIIDDDRNLKFIVNDFGVGVFRNVIKKRHLRNEFEAMQELLKGKTTTAPQAHSGEGIFFTSKVADRFVLESFVHRLVVDNLVNDVFFEEQKPSKAGTRVIFLISKKSRRHLIDIFRQYETDPEKHAFDKTEIRVRLYTMGNVYISRSQARRILAGLNKFQSVVFDFNRVPTVGQAFADEIFRVFRNSHPKIMLEAVNMNEGVKFMVERAQNEAKISR